MLMYSPFAELVSYELQHTLVVVFVGHANRVAIQFRLNRYIWLLCTGRRSDCW